MRFDGQPNQNKKGDWVGIGRDGTMEYNVVLFTNGIMVKGKVYDQIIIHVELKSL